MPGERWGEMGREGQGREVEVAGGWGWGVAGERVRGGAREGAREGSEKRGREAWGEQSAHVQVRLAQVCDGSFEGDKGAVAAAAGEGGEASGVVSRGGLLQREEREGFTAGW